MREIKFRGWDGFGGRMVFWTLNDLLVRFDADEKYGLDDSPSPFYKWMQFTGLKDRNGVEIYEGDIIKTDLNETVVIEWGKGFKKEAHEPRYFLSVGFHILVGVYFSNGIYGEIIGNIYENPELLK